MARIDTLGNFLIDIANAIRDKKGTTDTITPANFDTEIANIETGVDIYDYFDKTPSTYGSYFVNHTIKQIPELDTSGANTFAYAFTQCSQIKTLPFIDTSNATSFRQMFSMCSNLKTIPALDFSKGTSFNAMFGSCSSLVEVPEMNTGKGTDFNSMFYGCTSLTTVPAIDTSSGTDLSGLFFQCTSLPTIPELNTSKTTAFYGIFYSCASITEIPNIDTSAGTDFYIMFQGCTNLETVPQLDMSKSVRNTNMFKDCTNLTNFGGCLNLGKGYLTTASSNYANYTLDLSSCTKLTHESLMNVINGLYDIASIEVQPQQLILGSENLEKLTEEEIAIATDKGWTVS